MNSVSSWYEDTSSGLKLHVHVQTRCSDDEVVGLYNNRLKIHITAAPVDGKANTNLQSLLAKQFGTAKSRVSLLKGKHNKYKSFFIQARTREPDWFTVLIQKSAHLTIKK